jgi:hypothetical protein
MAVELQCYRCHQPARADGSSVRLMAVAGVAPGPWPMAMGPGRPAIDLCEGCKWELARWLRTVSLDLDQVVEGERPGPAVPRWLRAANGA